MPNGEVTFFHDRKGYGFLETEEADDDVFFHMDDIDGPEPQEGDEFEIEIEDGPRGLRAKQLEPLEATSGDAGF
jgi:CspA family cold shock protein